MNSNFEKTPNTGDKVPTITSSIIALVIIMNILQITVSKKAHVGKHAKKEKFIK